MRSRSRALLVLVVSALATTFLSVAPAQAAAATDNANFSANVMAPLTVSNWPEFDNQLQTVKAYGVDAVSVDVWWGQVEAAGDNNFNWSYYDTIFSHITAKGLQIVPIFSFHQCGGNVGDTCNIPLPNWVWGKYAGQTLGGIAIGSDGLKYRSEKGNYSTETVQLWADTLVQNEYVDFTNSFKTRYGATYGSAVQEINVSLGPAGELRYPSYNGHDSGSGYPTRGALQSYSSLAIKDFQVDIVAKYGSLAAVNTAWGTSLTNQNQIQPPSNASFFFTSGDYKNIKYGKDFVDWYNQSLIEHGKTMLDSVIGALGNSFPTAKIGYKVPGVHWAMTNPSYPRAAEVAAGLIQTSIDVNADATGHGYQKIVGLAKQFGASGRSIVLHFTCLEMDDQNSAPQYSQAKSLIFWVAQNAAAQGVAIKGENALAGGVSGDAGWNNINNAFDHASYVGLTTLRIGDVASDTGLTRYAAFIQKYRPSTSVTVHFAEFASAAGYSMHPFNGLTGDRPMIYEGYFNGRHWWKVTVVKPPAAFQLCFVNSAGTWDGGNRNYTGQKPDIYVLPSNNTVYTARP